MPVEYKRQEYSPGLSFTEIYDGKFKSFAVIVKFVLPMDLKKAPLYSLAADIIASVNRRFPEKEKLSRELTRLYSASISSSSSRIGNYFSVSLDLSCVCDDYTIGREKISKKAACLLLDCLFDPYLENGLLSEKYFRLCQSDMLDDIESMINNKRRYAVELSKKYIFKDEIAGITALDYKEYVAGATLEDVTEAYREMLRIADITVSVTGGYLDAAVKQKLIDSISGLDREPICIDGFASPSKIKDEVCRAEVTNEANQSQLVIAYKTPEYSEYASKLFVAMLGATPTSKLFSNVREKMSLCYYCSAAIFDLSQTLLISSGLDEENLSLAEDAIKAQIDAMKNGDFTDEEFEDAKLYLAEAYLSNYDSKYDINSWYAYQHMKGTNDSPEEKGAKIRALTREDVISEANGYKLDTVFVMKPENGGAGIEA